MTKVTIFPTLHFLRHLLGNPRSSRRGTEVTHCAHITEERKGQKCLSCIQDRKGFSNFLQDLVLSHFCHRCCFFSHYLFLLGGKTGHVLVFPKRTGSPVVRSNKEGRILHGASPTSFRSRGRWRWPLGRILAMFDICFYIFPFFWFRTKVIWSNDTFSIRQFQTKKTLIRFLTDQKRIPPNKRSLPSSSSTSFPPSPSTHTPHPSKWTDARIGAREEKKEEKSHLRKRDGASFFVSNMSA